MSTMGKSLLDLDDLCLERVFKFCDAETIVEVSQTSVLFNKIAKNLFKTYTDYECFIDSFETENFSTNVIRNIGKHLTSLHISFGHSYTPTSYTSFFEVLMCSLSDNVRDMHIGGQLCAMPLEMLRSSFLSLEKLSLQHSCTLQHCIYYLDLFVWSPNLKDLDVTGKLEFAPNHRKSFKQLEKLDIFRPEDNFYSTVSFKSFVRQNQQLKSLFAGGSGVFVETMPDIDMSYLIQYLKNLEHLTLSTTRIIDLSADKIIALQALKKLQSLRLCNIGKTNDSNIILHNVTALKSLKVLTLNAGRGLIFFSSSLVGLASELKHLQAFEFTFFCQPEIIIDFVRHAKSLRTLSVRGGFKSTPEFVREMTKARMASLAENKVLSCCLGNWDDWDDIKQVFEEPDVQHYLKFDKEVDSSTIEELLSN